MAWSPWAEIGQHPEVAVYVVPAPAPGLYFADRGVIVIADGSSRATRRSALAEELALRFRLGDLDGQERRRLAGATRRGT